MPHDRKPKIEVTIEVDDIGILDGIFKDAYNTVLSQIPIQSIGPEAQGVVVVKAELVLLNQCQMCQSMGWR